MDKTKAIIVGERIYFRWVEEADIYRGWLDWVNDPDLTANLYIDPPITAESLKEYYQKMKLPHAAMFAVCQISDDAYIGNAKIGVIDWKMKVASCGRLIGKKEARGKGVGTEILKLLLTYGFKELGMHRLQTGVAVTNIASIRSNEKAGMRREGVRKEAVIVNGKYEDVVLFGMLKNEFK